MKLCNQPLKRQGSCAENQGFLSSRALPKTVCKQLADGAAALHQWEGKLDLKAAVEEV